MVREGSVRGADNLHSLRERKRERGGRGWEGGREGGRDKERNKERERETVWKKKVSTTLELFAITLLVVSPTNRDPTEGKTDLETERDTD